MARKHIATSILQVDAQCISRLRIRPGAAKIEVLSFDQLRGPWNSDDASLGTALGQFAQEHALADDLLYIIVPAHEVTSRLLSLPSQSEEEIGGMVRMCAPEYVPFNIEDLIVGHAVLSRQEGGESRVLAVWSHREVVEGQLKLLAEAGLEPEQIFLSTACLASAAMAALGAPEDNYALACLASGGLEVLVLGAQGLLFSRGVATVQDWTLSGPDAHHAREELAIEIRGSLSSYRRESPDGTGADTIYLCSECTDVSAAVEALTEETGKTCSQAAFLASLLADARSLGTTPLTLIGGALAAEGRASVRINLLPEAISRGREWLHLKARVLQIAGLAAVLLLALGALNYQTLAQRHRLISDLESQISAIAPQALGVAEKETQLQILRRQVDHKGSILELLAVLSEAAPPLGVNVARLTYNRQEGINLWGRALAVDLVHNFAEAIRGFGTGHLNLLSMAVREYESATKERDLPVFDYQITIPFPEVDANEDR